MSKRIFLLFVLTIAMSLMAVEFRRSYANDHSINTVYVISDKISCEAYGGTWEDSGNTCSVEFWNVKNTDVVTIESNVVFQGMFFLNNYGTINNYGTFTSFDLYNDGPINNYGQLKPGFLYNSSLVNNYGTIFNINSNPYGITNPGTIDNHCQGEITGPGTIAPTQIVVNTPGSDACQNNLTPTSTPTSTDTPTNTPDVPTPTATPTSTPVNVVLFIPGIGGSRLQVPSDEGNKEIWPSIPYIGNQGMMTLKNGGDTRILTDDAVRKFPLPQVFDVYEPLIRTLKDHGYVEYETEGKPEARNIDCRVSQKNATLFIFPWDWRYGIAYAVDPVLRMPDFNGTPQDNVILLKSYISCIQKIHPSANITIIAHSMGGLLARRYILETADHSIERLITIDTPWLGTPDTIKQMITGDWMPWQINAKLLKSLVEYFPGVHQLLPARKYYELSTDTPFATTSLYQGFYPLLHKVPYGEFPTAFKSRYAPDGNNLDYQSNVAFVGNNEVVFNEAQMYDWSQDTTGVAYDVFYGINILENTVGAVYEKYKYQCNIKFECTGIMYFEPQYTKGDKTVTQLSMARNDVLNGSATIYPLIFDGNGQWWNGDITHLGMTQSPTIHSCILGILGKTQEPCTIGPAAVHASDTSPSQPGYYLKIWGSDTITISDGMTYTTDLAVNGYMYDLLPGLKVDRMGGNAYSIVIPSQKAFTATITSDTFLSIEASYGIPGNITRTIKYDDLPVNVGEALQIQLSPQDMIEVLEDRDGDGVVDTRVAESADLSLGQLSDTKAPTVTINYSDQSNFVTISATDENSGIARIVYSTNGVDYHRYDSSFARPEGMNKIYARAEDNAGNISDIVEYEILITKDLLEIFLPIVTR